MRPEQLAVLPAFLTVLRSVHERDRTYTGILAMMAVGDTHCILCASCGDTGRESLMSVTGVVAHMREHPADVHDLVVDEERALAGDTVIGLPSGRPS